MLPVVVFGALVVGVLALVWIFVQPKLALRRHRKLLRLMSVTELAGEALRGADAAGIRSQFPAASLFDRQRSWNRVSLAKALDELYVSLDAEDRTNAAAGPGSWVYYWYDFGLAEVREVLDEAPSRVAQN